jgi:NADH-quinone oxidoreductase subunit C
MPEQERGEGEAPAGEQPAAAAEQPAAKPEQSAKAAEGKAPAKQAPPPGSIADLIKAVLPDVQIDASVGFSGVIVEIARDDIAKAMPALKDDPRLDLKFLRCLLGVDHADEGMEVIYQLLSYEKGHEVTVKTRLAKDDLRVASVAPVWRAADWHERETRDMFGIDFEGHPHLVPLLLPEDMTDHYPLRKENPLQPVDEWQGERLGENVGQAGHIPSGSAFEGAAAADGEDEE